MTQHRHLASGLAAAGALALALAGGAAAAGGETELLRIGRRSYAENCAGCHGPAGDGQGPAADLLIVKPRDFTSGTYKFRSTPDGSLPTDEDLYRTITRGVNRTAMPGFPLLPELERVGLVEVLKTLSPRFSAERPAAPIPIPDPPAFVGSAASVARGRELYAALSCDACHGEAGVGDGPAAATLGEDEWGNPQKPFNFTQGYLKSGPDVRDIYRTFMTGLNGTAMPSFYESFAHPDGVNIHEGDAWHLVSYVLSLRSP